MPLWSKIFSQNSNSPTIEHLMFFHDHRILLILSILRLTLSIIIFSLKRTNFNQFLLESHETELFWTAIPALILMFIALPSLKTLYIIEENIRTTITIKTIGLQWYWVYNYSNIFNKETFSSSIINSIKIRTEMTNKRLIIPRMTPTRMLITSKDVLHSWTIPSIGVKSDAIPGRINQIMVLIKRPRVLIGQCSEICGAGHRFIPIYLESPNIKNFLNSFLCSLIKA